MKKTKISPIHAAQAEMLMEYFKQFKTWPERLDEMLNNWESGFDKRNRRRDIKAAMNYLAETGRIRFEVEPLPSHIGLKPGIVFYLTEGREE